MIVLLVAFAAAYGALCLTIGCLIGHTAARRYERSRRGGMLP